MQAPFQPTLVISHGSNQNMPTFNQERSCFFARKPTLVLVEIQPSKTKAQHFNPYFFQFHDGKKNNNQQQPTTTNNNQQQPTTTNNQQQPTTGTRGKPSTKNTATKKTRVYSKILRIFVGTKVMDPTVLHLHAGTDAQRYQWPCLRGAQRT